MSFTESDTVEQMILKSTSFVSASVGVSVRRLDQKNFRFW